MKKNIIALTFILIFLAGCQQAQELQQNAANTVNEASKQIETAKTQVIETKAKIDEKVTQAQEAADAVGKLTQ